MPERCESHHFRAFVAPLLVAESDAARDAFFRTRRLSLRVVAAPLALPGRRVWGEWDPLLRRIALYGAAASSDAHLVRVLLHELRHACDGSARSEFAAETAANSLMHDLPAATQRSIAGWLRQQAVGDSPVFSRQSDIFDLSVSVGS